MNVSAVVTDMTEPNKIIKIAELSIYSPPQGIASLACDAE